LCPSFN
ncbi:hypothetical protein VCHC50A2_0890C, partial [Vibrio cholerae HC-50A2]